MGSSSNGVSYAVEGDLSAAEFIDVLRRSGLAERRPVDDPGTIAAMLKNASLTVCARDDDGRLIGVARSLTDFAYCCYLSDLAVDRAWQGRGIGRRLMDLTHEKAGGAKAVTLLLLSAPGAMTYYPQAGMAHFDNCFGRRRTG
ncbi:GNAT family N-acetyltransferase [Shumkonia mesophila]|uniref:GNAT family N-acetyltransferase n=1 Tax=Shumkonia mesophila TaxID=2838854 RepID=UPI0029342A66|nr:GNAT family N-acetyltransferase [Shumkonia mesophila]